MAKETIEDIQARIDLLKEEASIQQSIYEGDRRRTKALKESEKIQKQIVAEEKKLVAEKDREYKASKPFLDISKSISKQISNRNKEIAKGTNLAGKGNKLAQNTLKTEKGALSALDQSLDMGQITIEQAQTELDFLDSIKSGEVDLAAMKSKSAEYGELATQALAEGNEELAEYYKDMGKVINLKMKETKANQRNKKLLESADVLTGGMASKAVDFVKAFAKNPLAGVLTIGVALVGLFFKAITAAAAKVDEIGKTFGALGKDKAFLTNMLQAEAAAIKVGSNLQEVISVTNELNDNFGIGLSEATNLASRSIEVGRALGLGADEAGRLFGTLSAMGFEAEPFIESATNLALAADVAPAAVLKDIANSADDMAAFTKDGGDNIAAAAVQAKKLGLNLSTSAKVAQGLLQFQDSITKELEASVLTGRRLNFQKARELALNNDIEGSMKAVLDQLGGEAEFNKLNAIQRQAVADSIGVSVGELAKMAANSDKLTMSSAMAAGNFEDMLDKGALSGFSKFVQQMKAIGAQLFNAIAPHLEKASDILANVFGDGTDLIEPMAQSINEMGETFTAWLEGWAEGLGEEGTGGMIQKIVGLFESLPETLASILGAVEAITRAMLAYKMASLAIVAVKGMIAVAEAGASGSAIPFGGPIAAGLMLASLLAAYGAVRALSFADLPVGKGANLKSGKAIFDPGETVVNDVDLAQMARSGGGLNSNRAMESKVDTQIRQQDKLLSLLDGAFGTGGKMFKGLRVKE